LENLSIITVNLNNLAGLKKTIESVYAQTWKKFEYIIVDGGSTDGSKELIEQLSSRDECSVRYISEPDNGVYQAMNKGIKMASGEYLLFLNSGDYLVNENVLETVFSKKHVADFLIGIEYISKDDKIVWTMVPPKKITFGYLYNVGLPHQSTFIKRDTFLKFGFYREDFVYNSDVEYWYRTIIFNVCTTETLNDIISNYNLDGISTNNAKTAVYQKEKQMIYDNPLLQLFIPDYDEFNREKVDVFLINWIRKNKILYKGLFFLYKFSNKLHKKWNF